MQQHVIRKRSTPWAGIRAVITTLACAFSTAVFLPGVLMKVGVELSVARVLRRTVRISGFLREFGGEVESEEKDMPWTRFLFMTILTLYVIGAILMLPALIEVSLLDIRPFAAVSSDPSLVVSRDTSFVPLYDLADRVGVTQFWRLWFGVSAVVCCLPSSAVLDGALKEQRRRPRRSVSRWLLAGPLNCLRVLRALDQLVTYLLVSGYLVSGLIVGYLSWRAAEWVLYFAL